MKKTVERKVDVKDLARKVKIFFCDSDGVMFPNTVLMGFPFKVKYRSYYDGQGVSLLRAVGIQVVFITNEKGKSADAIRETVKKFNSLPSSKPQKPNGWDPVFLFEGKGGVNKLQVAKKFLKNKEITLNECAYMGDDLVDKELLKEVGLAAAPAQAEKAIKEIVHFVSNRDAGSGAVRDFANMILDARGINPFDLPAQ